MPVVAASTQKKVLIAESDSRLAQAMMELLSRQGLQVIVARDSREALQKALAENPDAILLDNTLPGIGEMDICAILKKNKVTCEIPVGLLTGSEAESQAAARQARALLVIPRSFKPQQLISSVGLLLSARRKKPTA